MLLKCGVVEPGGAGAGEAHFEPDIRVSRSGGGSDRQGFPDSAGICSGYGLSITPIKKWSAGSIRERLWSK